MIRIKQLLILLLLIFSDIRNYAQEPRLAFPLGHTSTVSFADFSPDGRLIVTVSQGDQIKIWRVNDGILLTSVEHPKFAITSAKFSNDNRYLLIESDDAMIWQVSDGKLVSHLQMDKKVFGKLNFSDDGKFVISETYFRIWRVNDGKLISRFEKTINISPDKKHFLLPETNNNFYDTIEIRKITDENYSVKLNEWFTRGFTTRFSPNGEYLLTTNSDLANSGKTNVRTWQVSTGKLINTFNCSREEFSQVKFNHDGSLILAKNSQSGIVKIWKPNVKEPVSELGTDITVSSSRFSPDNKYIAASCVDESVKICKVSDGKPIFVVQNCIVNTSSIQFSPDCSQVLIPAKNKTIKILNVPDGNLIATLKENSLNCRYSPDGKRIVTPAGDSIKIWDSKNGQIIASLDIYNQQSIHRGDEFYVNFSPNGKLVVGAIYKDKSAKIWRINDGKEIAHLTAGNFDNITTLSPNMKYAATLSSGKSALIRDIFSGKIIATWKDNFIRTFASESPFSPDGKYFVTKHWNNTIKIRNSTSGELISELKGHKDDINSLCFDPVGNYIVTASDDNTAKVWQVKNGKLVTDLTGHTQRVNTAEFSPDGRHILTASDDHTAKIWRADTCEILLNIKKHSEHLKHAHLSPNGKYIVTVGERSYYGGQYEGEGAAMIWQSNNGQFIGKLDDRYYPVKSATFTPDSKNILTLHEIGGKIKQWDTEKGTYLAYLDQVENFIFSHDGKWLIIHSPPGVQSNGFVRRVNLNNKIINTKETSNAGSLISISKDSKYFIIENNSLLDVYNTETGELNFTYGAIDSINYFIKIPSGYYKSTLNTSRQLYYVTKNLKVITFDQLDVRYNRPDLVLAAIGSTDTNLINAYRLAYYKRMEKLGIDTTAFRDNKSVPEADFVNREEIEHTEQTDEKLTLYIKAHDSTYNLDRYNVWVNEVPLFGINGTSIRRQKKKDLMIPLTITLSNGDNRIEASVINTNGIESYRVPLSVKHTPVQPKEEKVYFIGIGINRFADTSQNLQYCEKDIRDLVLKLKEKYGPLLQVDTLFNENVTVEKVKALKDRLLQSKEDDKVIIAYSGHGLFNKKFDYYLSTYDINFNQPENNGLPYEVLENLTENIKARKKLMLIDACHSGEIDSDEMLKIMEVQAALQKENKGVFACRGVKLPPASQGNKLGIKNSFELMQELFVNVRRRTGTTVISAAAGTQFALERNDLTNGVFTYSILELLNTQRSITVSELKKHVGSRVSELTKGLQQPTARIETQQADWILW